MYTEGLQSSFDAPPFLSNLFTKTDVGTCLNRIKRFVPYENRSNNKNLQVLFNINSNFYPFKNA